jgi:hypothetical protein
MKTVEEAVLCHLIPKDRSITREQIKRAFEDRGSLLLIDGFDEAAKDNPLVDDIVERKLLTNATVVVASRPGFLTE